MEEVRQKGLSTRGIVTSGVLGAIAIFLGASRLGFIPMPTGINATIMHVPAIIGGILEGPVVGGLIGMIFGIYSFAQATTPMFKDPIVAIVPRIFIGIVAAWAYAAARPAGEWWGIAIAAIVGTATNTVLVLWLGVVRHYLPAKVAVTVGLTHGIPEIIVAVIVSLAVLLFWKRVQTGQARARV
ncbi:MAG: ECF transporter S component [Bacillati bacterium ANGP1]|uniref:ECF transporter S component n=1 Tax=Candidatus Segetimicrobium genomatis TaxID=2569760 RepID=A0A537J4V3_9BACT|nr:MAG: ECF transporter S component [Terrabacteria group bacterium ANGP1]